MRQTTFLKENFKFKKFPLHEADLNAVSPDYDDSHWKTVSVPHDWGIEGAFSADNDPSYRMVVQDGIKTPILHTGRSGGLPIVGEGIYRTWITIDTTEKVVLEFDGIMNESHIYINGREVGGCHWGYISYEVDITDYVTKGDNLLAIHAVVQPECSRWYPGGGIYRNIRLVTKPREHICYDGVWVRQIYADKKSALFEITLKTMGTIGFTAKITDPKGEVTALSSKDNILTYLVEDPMLWDVDEPNLYSAEITVASGDSVTVRFGAKNVQFTNEGFFLNGRRLKMNGVCLHHDMGSIGVAVNRSALSRQLDILQGMGVNALRTSHNPPAPELLDLCDERGILVMDEFTDEWILPKVKNGYHKCFEEHAVSDLERFILRDRNHPSIIMWSIGNEIAEQREADGWRITRLLNDTAHRMDPTRPTTAGCESYLTSFKNRFAYYLDIVGLNYKPVYYKELKEKFPALLMVGSETASCISTRGVYEIPEGGTIGALKNEQLTVSDYGLSVPHWACHAERELAAQADCPYVMGEFVWTGFDYLGEPTPYYSEWPSRSSYFGVIDLAGLPKNRYYCYRAAWSDLPTLHIFPHWNWEGKEGQIVPIHVYTNYEEVELFINDISQGKRRHAASGNDVQAQLERFRLMWNETVYTPGEVCAVAYQNGKEVDRKTIRTAGEPYRIELSAYYQSIKADRESLNYITASIVDKDGNLCPNANNRLTFSAEGAAFVYATDAGDQRETETFLRADKKALSGMLVCCVRNNGSQGKTVVSCSADGLISASISFDCI